MGGVSREGSNRNTKNSPIWRLRECVLTSTLYVPRMQHTTAWVLKRMHYRASESLNVKVLDFV